MQDKAVILDRDGTLNHDSGYVHKVKDLKVLPFVRQGLGLLQENGFRLFIIQNQSGINRGYYTVHDMTMFNIELLFRLEGIRISRIYFCPHKPDEDCRCRKPKTKHLDDAVREFKLDRSKCWVIGDSTCDIKLAENAGMKSILVLTGRAGKDGEHDIKPTYIAKNLLKAAKVIIDDNN